VIHNAPNTSAELKLTIAVADLVHLCGFPFQIAGHAKFWKVVALAKTGILKNLAGFLVKQH
jgi:hypothetical protein